MPFLNDAYTGKKQTDQDKQSYSGKQSYGEKLIYGGKPLYGEKYSSGGVEAGAGTLYGTSGANDLLGGMVGGFGGPMDWKGAGFGAQAGGMSRTGDVYLDGDIGRGFGAAGSDWSMDRKTGMR